MSRVLVVTNRIPYPLEDGWKRRTFHVLRAVAARRPVTLATLHAGDAAAVRALARELGGDVEVLTVRPSPWSAPLALLLGAVTPEPYHVWKLRSAALRRAIEAATRRSRFDVAIATMAHLHPYLEALSEGILRVVDTHNVDSVLMARYAARLRGARRAYARATAAKLRRHEERVFVRADRVWVCSEAEVADVLERAPGARVHVIPNGVDARGEFAARDVAPSPKRVLFFGRLDYYPNRDAVEFFVESILPRVRASEPDVEFDVVGPGGEALRDVLASDPSCRLTGPADNLADAVSSAAVVVVPLRMGGGTRLKILEALALRRAVVSTTVGAEGLALAPGRDLVLADEPDAFAAAVLDLLRHPSKAAQLGHEGRCTVERRYDWNGIEAMIQDELGLCAAEPRLRPEPTSAPDRN